MIYHQHNDFLEGQVGMEERSGWDLVGKFVQDRQHFKVVLGHQRSRPHMKTVESSVIKSFEESKS